MAAGELAEEDRDRLPLRAAPEWQVSQWFNTDRALGLADFRGRVVVLHAFQMLCPGCVQSGLPQAQRVARLFNPSQVAVVGLHTVFEHHGAMTPEALAAFIHEYRLTFPIGIDMPAEHGPIPATMASYGMQGTPTLILIDQRGRLRKHSFGVEEDMRVGADIALLLNEREPSDGA
jgi:peroxiredoxin